MRDLGVRGVGGLGLMAFRVSDAPGVRCFGFRVSGSSFGF